MKIYYVTRDLLPTDNYHYITSMEAGVIIPDMSTVMAQKGLVVSDSHAKIIRKEYGRDAVSFFEIPNMYGREYHELTLRVTLPSGCIDTYYVKAE